MISHRAGIRLLTSALFVTCFCGPLACSSDKSSTGQASAGKSHSSAAGGKSSVSNEGSAGEGAAGGIAGEANSGSGGADSVAGAAGAASNSYPTTLYRPTTITDEAADVAYVTWKENFLEDCQDGSWRVKWSDPTLTVSEGIAYGMLLTVIHDEQQIFDGLWKYYKNNANSHGLMHWRRAGCPGAASGDNAATDAELDAAMALIMASRRWSSTPYLDEAKTLIGAIKTYETVNGEAGLTLLKPGDMFGGSTCLNFSYFAPAYYRVFAEVIPEQAEFWTKLAKDSYTLINEIAHPTTGLVPNWCDQTGATAEAGAPGCTYYKRADQYGSDAARTPWRIATDFAWYGTPEAYVWLNKLTSWVRSVGVANVMDWYQLDGTATGTVHSVVVVGAFANAAMAVDQGTADEFFSEVVTMEPQSTYYPSSLRALYTLLPLGRFTPSAAP